jgi:hypothetical protein
MEELATQCREFADMDFGLLYSPSRELFAIGFNVSERRLDASYYDLLASEARLASFVVIAQGKFGQEHWFALGRLLTSTGSTPALLSWSGSMFEYLMPLLVMPNYENTLLDRTYQAVVRRQIEYGRQRRVPGGFRSGYNTIDQHKTYQYRAFGVPGRAQTRVGGGSGDCAHAVCWRSWSPRKPAATWNGWRETVQQGDCGFEAIDYTPARCPRAGGVTVRQFMAHHEGMSLLALAYVLLDQPMQRASYYIPCCGRPICSCRAVPKTTHRSSPRQRSQYHSSGFGRRNRKYADFYRSQRAVEVHLLSNGSYHVAVTSGGGGIAAGDHSRNAVAGRCHPRQLWDILLRSRSRYREALVNSWQPTRRLPKGYEAIFTQAGRIPPLRRSDRDVHPD